MEGISKAARSFVKQITLRLMTVFDHGYGGIGLFIIYIYSMQKQMFNSIYLLSKSCNGGKRREGGDV